MPSSRPRFRRNDLEWKNDKNKKESPHRRTQLTFLSGSGSQAERSNDVESAPTLVFNTQLRVNTGRVVTKTTF